MPHVIGECVILREYRESDLDEICRWVNNPDVTQYLSPKFDHAQTKAMTRAFVEKVLNNELPGYFFIIADRDDESYLGQFDLRTTDDPSHQASLSIIVPARINRGKGYGREAMRLGLQFGFQTANLNRIWLYVLSGNTAAIQLYRSLGFLEEGVLREDVYRHGKYLDVIVMAILRREWEARNARSSTEPQ